MIVPPEELPVKVRVSDGTWAADVLHQGLEVGGEQPLLLLVFDGVQYATGQVKCIVT